MKSLKVLSLLCVCFLVSTLILNPCVTYASILTASGSNALMTMELDDSDYAVMPMSSIGTVENTISGEGVKLVLRATNGSSNYWVNITPTIENGRFSVSASTPLDGYYYDRFHIEIRPVSLPNAGGYLFGFDLSSQFSIEYGWGNIYTYKNDMNAASSTGNIALSFNQESGDIYVSPFQINLTNVSNFVIQFGFEGTNVRYFDSSFAVYFKRSDVSSSAPSTAGTNTSSQEYESGVSSSLSDLSSSVESVEEEISLVTQAIQTLQGAMEPHYDNVLTQLHHITEQLHAFYDQVYNNIHLPELDMLTQIRTAIENIDLQIEVDISEVKTAINNMSTAVQNKLQATTDQITGGYDNSQQTQQNQQLQDSINAYDEVEEDIFEDVDGFMQEFEYPSFDSMNGSVIKALAFIGGFLQSIFLSMGDFGTIITFSLTMIFVMIIVGYHRIRS